VEPLLAEVMSLLQVMGLTVNSTIMTSLFLLCRKFGLKDSISCRGLNDDNVAPKGPKSKRGKTKKVATP